VELCKQTEALVQVQPYSDVKQVNLVCTFIKN